MLSEKRALIIDSYAAKGAATQHGIKLGDIFEVECWNNDRLKWKDHIKNLVVNVGLNDVLTNYLKGAAYTAAHYVGITATTPTFVAADTMSGHGGWTEVTAFDEATRQLAVWGSVSSQAVSNTASKATFTISADSTVIGGAFLCTNDTKGGSTGTLYGGGAFNAGDKTLDDNDILYITVTAQSAAA